MNKNPSNLRFRRICFEQMESRRVLAASLDPTFGDQGVVIENIRTSTSDDLTDIVALPSGGYIAVGTSDVAGNTSLIKYSLDGTVDRSFGDDGRSSIITGQQLFSTGGYQPPHTKSIAVDHSGRILVAGYLLNSPSQNFAVVRFTADGRLDSSFGINGTSTVFGPFRGEVFDVAVDQQDRIILVGSYFTDSQAKDDFAVVRLLSNGNLDSSFADTGVRIVDFDGRADQAIGVAIASSGQIVVAGRSSVTGDFGPEDYRLGLIGLLPNGQLDNLFGVNGKQLLTGPAGSEFIPADLQLDASGSYLVGGRLMGIGTSQQAVAKFTTAGTPNQSFGDNGWQTPNFENGLFGRLASDLNGNIWVIGSSYVAGTNTDVDVAIGKLLPSGQIDQTFGQNGIQLLDFANYTDLGRAIVFDQSNNLIIAATARETSVPSTADFALAKMSSSGQLDSSFGLQGKVLTDFGAVGSTASAFATAEQTDGSLLVAGDVGIARFSPLGIRDEFFGLAGMARTSFRVLDLVTDSQNRILATGSQNSDFVVARFLQNGQVDTSFGDLGSRRIDFSNRSDVGNSLAIDSLGRIVVVGYSFQPAPSNQDFAVARLTDNGDLDPTFGNGGTKTIDFNGASEQAYSVSIDSQDRIVIGGQSSHGGSTQLDFAIVRLLPDGQLDGAFGLNGISFIDFAGLNDGFSSLVVDEFDRVIALGSTPKTGGYNIDFALTRLTANGLLDSSFASGGKLIVDIASSNDFPGQVSMDSQGRIIAVGSSNVPLPGRSNNFDFSVVRILESGLIDTTFGGTGIQTIDLGSDNDYSRTALIDSQDRIVVTGSSDRGTPTFDDWASIRLIAENAAPIANAGGPYEFDEGTSFNLDGSLSYDNDNPLAALSFAWDLDYDGVSFHSDLVGVSSNLQLDDNFAARTIALKVTDPFGFSSISTTTLTINNVAPYAISISLTEGGVRGQTLRLEGTFNDPGLLDTHTFEWSITKDGLPVATTAPTNQQTLSFVPSEEGIYSFTLKVTDDDGGVGSAVRNMAVSAVAVQSDPIFAGRTQLVVGGSMSNDQIHFRSTGAGIYVDLNTETFGPYSPDRIVVYAQDGDDTITLPSSIRIDASLFGGNGNDSIKGGSGNNIIVGGNGDDFLQGNSGRDVIIGGRGADRILGSGDDDLLIASWTNYDSNNLALIRILKEWTSELGFESRVNNVRYGNGSLAFTGVKLNQNVFADYEVDHITGSSGDDWFIWGSEDNLSDLKDKKLEADFDWLTN